MLSQLRFDSESGIVALVGKMPGLDIMPTASGEHVPIIERMQRTIKDRVRSVKAGQAFTVPLSIAPYLVLFAVSRPKPTSVQEFWGWDLCPRTPHRTETQLRR